MKTIWMRGALASLALGGCVAEEVGDEQVDDGVELTSHEDAIVNGETSAPHSQPWIVNLRSRGRFFCGGTILAPGWVVTAAHCVQGTSAAEQALMRVVAGDHNLTQPEQTEQRSEVDEIIVHELYPTGNGDHDIALLRLHTPFRITNFVQTVALPTGELPLSMLSMGWGQLSEPGDVATFLQEGKLDLMPLSNCARFGATDLEFCAGGTSPNGPIDTCFGDSGGPILNIGSMRRELYGIVSRGDSRCRGTGVYTSVRELLPWIHEKTDNERLRGNFRVTWTGLSAKQGQLEISCSAAGGDKRRAPTWVPGVEAAIDCPAGSDVSVSCRAGADQQVTLSASFNGGLAFPVAWGTGSTSASFRPANNSDTYDWSCDIAVPQ